jgi:hypothetical protein
MSILELCFAETAAVFNENNLGKRIVYYNPQTGKYSPGYGILKELNVDVYHCSRLSCDTRAPNMQWCGGCNNRVYCSKECQVDDWKSHKREYCNNDEAYKSSKFSCAKIEFGNKFEYISMSNYVLRLFLVDNINDSVSFEDFIKLDKVKPEPRRPSTAHTMMSMSSSY